MKCLFLVTEFNFLIKLQVLIPVGKSFSPTVNSVAFCVNFVHLITFLYAFKEKTEGSNKT